MGGIRQGDSTITLASNASATSGSFTWGGGSGIFTAEATFGGGTVKLQFQTKNGTWLDVGTDTTLTAAGVGAFSLPPSTQIRVNIATATAVYAYAIAL